MSARSTRLGSRPLHAACLAALLLSVAACDVESSNVEPSAYPTAGLYTPGSPLGASDPTDIPVEGAGLGERCNSLPALPAGVMPTKGTLEVRYTTQSLDGRYAPRNCTAVWIETMAGAYVATIELGAGLRKPGLVYFQDHACTARLGPDVVTSATLADHVKPHMAKWEGLDFEEKLVADGPYKLFIEVTESDKEPGELTEFAFDKGPTPFDMEAPVDFEGPLAQVNLKWTPMATGGGSAGSGGN
jgi:hypothetical protein